MKITSDEIDEAIKDIEEVFTRINTSGVND